MILNLISMIAISAMAQTPTIHCENPGAEEYSVGSEDGFIRHNSATGGGAVVHCGTFSKYAGDDSELSTISFKSKKDGKVYKVDSKTIKYLCGDSTLGAVFNPPAESTRSTGKCLSALKAEITVTQSKGSDLKTDDLKLDGADYSKMTLRLLQSDNFTYTVDGKSFAEQCWYSNTKAEFYVNGSSKAEDKVCVDVGMACKAGQDFGRKMEYCKSLVKADEACNISATECYKQDEKSSPALNVRTDQTRPECKTFASDLPLEELQRQLVACLSISRSATSDGSNTSKKGTQ